MSFWDDSELLKKAENILSAEYSSLSEEQLVEMLQDFENRIARHEERQPLRIYIMSEEESVGKEGEEIGVFGSTSSEAIGISRVFLDKVRLAGVPGLKNRGLLSSFTPGKLLETIIHEGRHAWQHELIANPANFEKEECWEMILCRAYYDDGDGNYARYFIQANETDARRFALNQMVELLGKLPPDASMRKALEEQIEIRFAEERAYFAEAVVNLKPEDLEKWEREAWLNVKEILIPVLQNAYKLQEIIADNIADIEIDKAKALHASMYPEILKVMKDPSLLYKEGFDIVSLTLGISPEKVREMLENTAVAEKADTSEVKSVKEKLLKKLDEAAVRERTAVRENPDDLTVKEIKRGRPF